MSIWISHDGSRYQLLDLSQLLKRHLIGTSILQTAKPLGPPSVQRRSFPVETEPIEFHLTTTPRKGGESYSKVTEQQHRSLMWWSPESPTHPRARRIDGLMRDCSISIANALETLQSYTKPSMLWFSKLPNPWDKSVIPELTNRDNGVDQHSVLQTESVHSIYVTKLCNFHAVSFVSAIRPMSGGCWLIQSTYHAQSIKVYTYVFKVT